jgi:hypothetical protein
MINDEILTKCNLFDSLRRWLPRSTHHWCIAGRNGDRRQFAQHNFQLLRLMFHRRFDVIEKISRNCANSTTVFLCLISEYLQFINLHKYTVRIWCKNIHTEHFASFVNGNRHVHHHRRYLLDSSVYNRLNQFEYFQLVVAAAVIESWQQHVCVCTQHQPCSHCDTCTSSFLCTHRTSDIDTEIESFVTQSYCINATNIYCAAAVDNLAHRVPKSSDALRLQLERIVVNLTNQFRVQ